MVKFAYLGLVIFQFDFNNVHKCEFASGFIICREVYGHKKIVFRYSTVDSIRYKSLP